MKSAIFEDVNQQKQMWPKHIYRSLNKHKNHASFSLILLGYWTLTVSPRSLGSVPCYNADLLHHLEPQHSFS